MHLSGIWRGIGVSGLVLALLIYQVSLLHGELFPLYLVQSQDFIALMLLACALLVIAFRRPEWRLPDRDPSPTLLLAIGIGLVLLLGWGAYVLMGDFPLSRDEHMVVFDMAVFDKGRIAAPMPYQWRAYALSLVPAFLINEVDPTALVSAYLPVNALLRLACSKIADPVFFNPLLVLIGGIALNDIAGRLLGDDRRARWVVLLLYGLSAQTLVTAMTTYAMTAHMALNLLWLCAFLRGGKGGHAAAIIISFLAVGLHQLVFHPLFVAPFLIWRAREGQWRLVLLYGVMLTLILGWWATYPRIVAWQTGVPPMNGNGQYDFIKMRVLPLLFDRNPYTVLMMVLNLLRFVAWQNFALVPLMIGAAPLAWRDRGLGGPLWWGIAGLLLTMTIILPFQGHGWGYRYLHPFLGSFALLGGLGYQRLVARVGEQADGMVVALSALTLLVAIPVLLTKAYAFVAPHVALEKLIAKQNSDFVLVDTNVNDSTDGNWAANAIDNVRNLPDLGNRPLRFSSRTLDSAMLADLCARGPVALVTRADMHRVGFALNVPERSPRFEQLVASIPDQSCFAGASRSR